MAQIIRNFDDVWEEESRVSVVPSGTSAKPRKPGKTKSKIHLKPTKWQIGEDILRVAKSRNNILRQSIYEEEGRFTIDKVNEMFGSFAAACTELHIINPENVDDYNMVLSDIQRVAEENNGTITAELYQEEGIFPYQDIDKRYGFYAILVKEGLVLRTVLYPRYPVKKESRYVTLRWLHRRY